MVSRVIIPSEAGFKWKVGLGRQAEPCMHGLAGSCLECLDGVSEVRQRYVACIVRICVWIKLNARMHLRSIKKRVESSSRVSG